MVTPETLTNRSGRQRQRGCYLGCDSSSASSSLSWSAVGTDVEPDAGGGRTKEIAFRLLGRELFERVRRVCIRLSSSLYDTILIMVYGPCMIKMFKCNKSMGF